MTLRPLRSARLAAALWLVFAFVVWNDVFDSYVKGGMYDYIARRARYEQGLEPRPTIDDLMRPAVRKGLLAASAWGLIVASAGLAAIAVASRRDARQRQSSFERDARRRTIA